MGMGAWDEMTLLSSHFFENSHFSRDAFRAALHERKESLWWGAWWGCCTARAAAAEGERSCYSSG